MLEIHRSALEKVIVPYHFFLISQNKTKKQLFGFVEGKDDPSYYQTHIDSIISDSDWEVILIEAGKPKGNRKQVLDLLNVIDWNMYSPKQTVFLIDRDLSDFIDDIPKPNNDNVYITDSYSIENNIVTFYTLKRVLKELYHMNLTTNEYSVVKEIFDNGLKKVETVVSYITCWYILLIQNGEKPSFGDLDIEKLCEIRECKTFIKENCEIDSYLRSRWRYDYSELNIDDMLIQFTKKNRNYSCIRGKYLIWYFVKFINSFCCCCNRIIPSIEKSVAGVRELNLQYAVIDTGTRSITPSSLKEFIQKTFMQYIKEYEN